MAFALCMHPPDEPTGRLTARPNSSTPGPREWARTLILALRPRDSVPWSRPGAGRWATRAAARETSPEWLGRRVAGKTEPLPPWRVRRPPAATPSSAVVDKGQSLGERAWPPSRKRRRTPSPFLPGTWGQPPSDDSTFGEEKARRALAAPGYRWRPAASTQHACVGRVDSNPEAWGGWVARA